MKLARRFRVACASAHAAERAAAVRAARGSSMGVGVQRSRVYTSLRISGGRARKRKGCRLGFREHCGVGEVDDVDSRDNSGKAKAGGILNLLRDLRLDVGSLLENGDALEDFFWGGLVGDGVAGLSLEDRFRRLERMRSATGCIWSS